MRIKNSLKNIYTGLLGQIVTLLITFITRTIFIKFLGTSYLGISSLFSNILTIFSLAELGVGQAIVFNLYKAIADDEKQKICALMNLYEKMYKFIGLFILVIGLSFTPFLHVLIKGGIYIENIKLIYILFVVNSASSYFYIYRSSFIIANQKNYIITKINYIFLIITNILQIVFLIISKNYIIYLLIQIILTIVQNIYISKKCIKIYPFLKNNKNYSLGKEEKSNIFKNIRALMVYKIGTISLNSTDNLIISYFVGITTVGLYSNYNLIVVSISGFLNIIFNSLTASIGNLVSKESVKKKKEMFNIINFSTFWIYGVSSICLFILMTPFVDFWIGNEFVLNNYTVLIISLNFYIGGMLFTPYTYRQTLGLFTYGKWRPVISAILNIFLSILLGGNFGLPGVLIATVITRILTNVWFDPYIVYSKGFNSSAKNYFKKYCEYVLVVILCGAISNYLCTFILGNGLIQLISKCIICLSISNGIIVLFYYRTEEFNYLYYIAKGLSNRIFLNKFINITRRNKNEEI